MHMQLQEIFVDIMFVSIVPVLLFLLGLPVSFMVRDFLKFHLFLAPLFGVCLLTLLVTVLFRVGVSVQSIFWPMNALALLPGCLCIWRMRAEQKPLPWKDLALVFIAFLSVMIVCLLPKWIAGLQFAVFQGNVLDFRGYFTSSSYYVNHAFAQTFADHTIDRSNGFLYSAAANLFGRPSAMLDFAFMTRYFPSHFYHLAYTYIVFFISLSLFPGALLANRLTGVSMPKALFVACLFPLGFWGQYTLDINAWSQAAAIAVLMGSLFLTFSILDLDAIGLRAVFARHWKPLIVNALLWAGGLFLYPENFILHLGLAGLVTGSILLQKPGKFPLAVGILASVVLATLTGLLYYEGTLQFLWGQFIFATQKSNNWHIYFYAFLDGFDGANDSMLLNWIDRFMSYMGFFFLSPKTTDSVAYFWLFRIGGGLLALGLVKALYDVYFRKLFKAEYVSFFTRFGLLFGVAVVAFYSQEKYWNSGKAFTYVAPFLSLAIASLFFQSARSRIGMVVALVFMLGSMHAGYYRIDRSFHVTNGYIYNSPYPAGSDWNHKALYNYDIRAIVKQIPDCSGSVFVDLDGPPHFYIASVVASMGKKLVFKSSDLEGTGSCHITRTNNIYALERINSARL